ncbi:MAG: prepilin-type N-terminal cleavage/methylation domain-containing protein [Patescibacteria group bacterium]
MKKISVNAKNSKGFTLLELLIVIAIIAILSVVLILVLNPAEMLKKSRDVQRISDLNTLKTAIGLYITSTSTPDLDTGTSLCIPTSGATAKISYSAELADSSSCATTVSKGSDAAGGSFSTTDNCRYGGTSGAAAIDGTGWLPVNLGSLTGGSPISNLPLDPVNTIGTATAPTSTDLVYRYACQESVTGGKPSYIFELDAQLESNAYTSEDDKRSKDGGDNTNFYEVGTSLRLLGSGVNF